jgi:hypothetical protein
MIDEKLMQYGTEREREYYLAVVKHGSNRKAAEALGCARRSVDKGIQNIKAKAARQGYAPEHDMIRTAPDGFHVKGASTYYKQTETTPAQWVKTNIDYERQQELMREFIAGMCEEIPQTPAIEHSGKVCNSDLLNCYVITDYHLGALSWAPETGADWDLEIAEATLVEWFRQAMAYSPDSETAVFAQISDFLHFDSFDAVTPASKHLLDASGRFPNLVRVAIRVLRQVIAMLLTKHKKVHLIMADANHDPTSQVWIREFFSVMYELDPRITVDTSPSPYNAYEFGKVALFTHHGHKRKPGNVSDVFVAQFRELYGRTKYAYAHMGHMHHTDIKENNLMVVKQHRTLAAPDAYSARGGYISGRDASVILYHRNFGQLGEVTVTYDMVKEGLKV